MGLLDKILKKNQITEELEIIKDNEETLEELEENYEFPSDELVSISNGYLDTTSKESIEKFKHNIEVLIKKAKENKKIDKFMIIREDDNFPYDWEWRVSSKNTSIEKTNISLSNEIRKKYALEKSNIQSKINGIEIPVSSEDITKALSKVDKDLGNVLLPSRFRSTKHFTINTPLGVTGDYNAVETNRNFIVMDTIDNFISSGYAYSVAYHDAYLDVSHESLAISKEAVVLIENEKYKQIMEDKELARQLSERKVVVYKGNEELAINMVLSEQGVLPSKVGLMYATYDNELNNILDSSVEQLAKSNNLLYNKSHGGILSLSGGHFSNYYDMKNMDYDDAIDNLTEFLKKKFKDKSPLFQKGSINNSYASRIITDEIGTDNLLDAINEYNNQELNRYKENFENYKKDRKSITPDIHNYFIHTTKRINDFYKQNVSYETEQDKIKYEEIIKQYLQASKVEEQLTAAASFWKLVQENDLDNTQDLSQEDQEQISSRRM